MRGIKLFGEKFKKKPFKALVILINDYLFYMSSVLFYLFIIIVKWPLALLDRFTGWNLRERFIQFIAYWSHA
jgi:hypothetical protein